MSEPRDPLSGGGSEEISAAADRARKQLREDFEQLRAEIGEPPGEEAAGGNQPSGAGLRSKARATVAALALTAAVATAAANFALNGGRSPKDGGASVPQPSPGGGATGITAGVGSAETRGHQSRPHLLSAVVGPGLGLETLTSGGGHSPAVPSNGPSSVFVVGQPVPSDGSAPSGGDVTAPSPVATPPAPAPPAPEPTQTPAAAPAPPSGKPPKPDHGGKGPGHGKGPVLAAVPGDGNPGKGGDHGSPGDAGLPAVPPPPKTPPPPKPPKPPHPPKPPKPPKTPPPPKAPKPPPPPKPPKPPPPPKPPKPPKPAPPPKPPKPSKPRPS